jgi:hypothetical protein
MTINIVSPKKPSAPALPLGIASDFSLVQERFPKLGEKILLMWGTSSLQTYLSKTIFDERGGRQGFPLPIVSALMRLYEYHEKLLPGAVTTPAQIWEDAK